MKALRIYILSFMMVLNSSLAEATEKSAGQLVVIDKPQIHVTTITESTSEKVSRAWKHIKAKLKDLNTIKVREASKKTNDKIEMMKQADLKVEAMQTAQRATLYLKYKKRSQNQTGAQKEKSTARMYEAVDIVNNSIKRVVEQYNLLMEKGKLSESVRLEIFNAITKTEHRMGQDLVRSAGDHTLKLEVINQGARQENGQPRTYTGVIKKKVIAEARSFSGQLGAFTAASLIMGGAMQSLGDSNPIALGQAVDAATDPYGWASFYSFVLGHRAVSGTINKYLLKPESRPVFKHMSNFSGMAAGMLISTTLHELMVDTDRITCGAWEEMEKEGRKPVLANAERETLQRRKLLKNPSLVDASGVTAYSKVKLTEEEIYNFKKNQADNACEAYHERWFTRDKYTSLIPDATTLIGAAAGGVALHSGVNKLRTSRFMRGMTIRVANRASASAKAALAALSPTKKGPLFGTPAGRVAQGAFVIGNFVIFLAFEHMLSPLVHSIWGPVNFKLLGWSLTDQIKEDKAKENSKNVRTYKKNLQEMEWLRKAVKDKSLHRYNTEFHMQGCIDQSLKKQRRPRGSSLYIEKPATITNESMDACFRRMNPIAILQNEYAFARGYKEMKLKLVKDKQLNWYTLLGNFTSSLSTAELFYKTIRDDLNKGMDIKEMAKPEYLNAIAGYQVSREAYPNSINGIQFKSFAEYLIYNMGCGAGADEKSKAQSKFSFYNTAKIEFVGNKYGSSLQFIPPRIAKFSKNVCRDYLDSRGYYRGRSQEVNEKNQVGGDDKGYVFTHKVADGNTIYDNIATYVLSNIENQAAIQPEESDSDEYTWWHNTIAPEIEHVWTNYNEAYEKLVKTDLLPKIYSEEYKNDYDPDKVSALLGKDRLQPFKSDIEDETIIGLNVQNIYNNYELILDLISLNGLKSERVDQAMDIILDNILTEARYHRTQLSKWKNESSIYSDLKSSDTEEIIQAKILPLEEIKAQRELIEEEVLAHMEKRLEQAVKPYTHKEINSLNPAECMLISNPAALKEFDKESSYCEGVKAPSKCLKFSETPYYDELTQICPKKAAYDAERSKYGPIFASLQFIEKKAMSHMLEVNNLTQKLGFKNLKTEE